MNQSKPRAQDMEKKGQKVLVHDKQMTRQTSAHLVNEVLTIDNYLPKCHCENNKTITLRGLPEIV